ncbi:MAG TPA: TlpA disulfide reductase family protein [Nitrospirota bacterium]|nr:TlpA disulfide reductase family protein [Nitrospirota bacterium]
MKTKDILFRLLLALFVWQISSTSVLACSVGDDAPGFSLKDISGKDWSLEDLKGKVVFINFWGTWCQPCKKELPALNELQRKNKEVVIIAINIDKTRESADTFLKKISLDQLTILLDPGTKVVSSFGARAMPTSYILDREGKVRFIHYGFNEKKDPLLWETELRELLNGEKI